MDLVKEKEKQVIETFLRNTDFSLPIEQNFERALGDAESYEWSRHTLLSVFMSIEDIYRDNREKEKE